MNTQQVKIGFSSLFAALSDRQARVPSRDNEIALSYMVKAEKSICKGMVKFPADTFGNIVSAQKNDKKGAGDFLAVKVNIKILRLLDAIGSGLASNIDDYTCTIVANALHNKGKIYAKSALVCLSRDIQYCANDLTQVIKHRMGVVASTASTQRSSTRQALNALGLATVTKNKSEDDIVLTVKGADILANMINGLSADDIAENGTENGAE
jgi:hypothetical protein